MVGLVILPIPLVLNVPYQTFFTLHDVYAARTLPDMTHGCLLSCAVKPAATEELSLKVVVRVIDESILILESSGYFSLLIASYIFLSYSYLNCFFCYFFDPILNKLHV